MNEKTYEDWLKSGYFCDSCGKVKEKLYTLEISCPITLCEDCIKKFHALLHSKNGTIIKIVSR